MTSEQVDHPDAERNARVIADFRANGSDRLVLLTTTGRKTDRLLELAKTGLTFVADYQQKTSRQIGIIALERQW